MRDNVAFEHSVRACATLTSPARSLRAALAQAAQALAGEGVSTGDITAMRWSARAPAAIHPARREIDLLLREVFGGLRRSIDVVAGDHEGVEVAIGYSSHTASITGAVWRNFTTAELGAAYSPRANIIDMDGIFEQWRERGADFRRANLAAELVYGPLRGEELDFYLPRHRSGPLPLWVFIHGGYWQAVDKEHNAHFAVGMLDAGYAVAMLNYTLAPEVSLDDILSQARAAIRFLAREAHSLGCDPGNINIAGHSAGGHLAAMIVSLPEGDLVRSCLALSGIFDIEPLARLPMGRTLRVTEPDAIQRLSPQNFAPLAPVRVGVAVGGLESQEFQRQSRDYAAHAKAECRIIPARNHFDLLEGLIGGALLDFAREIAR